MGSDVPAERRRLVPVVPRKFDRANHSATPSISRSDVSAGTAGEGVKLELATAPSELASSPTPPEPEPEPQELPSFAEHTGSNGRPFSNGAPGESWTVQNGSPPAFRRHQPSVDLNITFGEFSPSAADDAPAPEKGGAQGSAAASHVMTPTGSTTSYTDPTPFTQSDSKTVDNAGEFERGQRHAAAYPSFGPELPHERNNMHISEEERRRAAGGQHSHLGAFNPVVNGVPLVHNLLLSFNQPALSDLTLHVAAPNFAAPIFVHSVIVKMLPPIQEALAQVGVGEPAPRAISLRCANPYASFEALEAVVRMPYGGLLPGPAQPQGAVLNLESWARFHLANLAAASFFRFTEVADISADGLIPLMERNLSVTKKALECIYSDNTQFDPDAPPGHYRDPVKNGRFYHFKLFEAAKVAILASMASSEGAARRTLDYAAPAAPLLDGFPPATSPVKTAPGREHRAVRSGLSVGEVVLGPDDTATTLSSILLSVPAGFLNLLTRDARAELMLGAAVKEREDRRKAFVARGREAGLNLPDRVRWEERYELDAEGFPVINRYEVIRF